jgi:hypothetical protein
VLLFISGFATGIVLVAVVGLGIRVMCRLLADVDDAMD